jgi:hypothetical protein
MVETRAALTAALTREQEDMHKTALIPQRPGWLARSRQLLALCLAAARGAAAADPQADLLDFDIPAGPLGSTLLAIARRTGTLVSFKPGIVDPHQAPAVRGRLTLQQALERALAATGLAFQVTPSGVVTVVDRPAASGQLTPVLPTRD